MLLHGFICTTLNRYIHGSGATSEYLALSPSYKNPADTTDAQGIKITLVSVLIKFPIFNPPLLIIRHL